MEKSVQVKLIAEHWGCTDKNVYSLMKKASSKKKIEIMTLGSLCKENHIGIEELSNIIDFLEKARAING